MDNKGNISYENRQATKSFDFRSVLFLFDIDGTITDTKAVDDNCFINTLEELYDFDLSEIDWSDFEHVTDTGLTEAIYKSFKGRSISKSEFEKVQRLFFKKLSIAQQENPSSMTPVNGIQDFLKELNFRQIPVALATGGWRKSAEQKLRAASIIYNGFTLATSNDSHKRRTIMNVAIARAQFEYQCTFSHIIYFGDGKWDALTCDAMNIPMIGIDVHHSGELYGTSVEYIFNDYLNITSILEAVEQLLMSYE